MSKRKIVAAAKRRGLSVVYAHWGWAAGDYDSQQEWMVEFGPEIDDLYGEDEIQNFVDTSEALQWLEDLVALPPRPEWRPIAEAPQDGTRLMLWDSVSKRPVFASWRGGNPAITHYAAEPAGPEAALLLGRPVDLLNQDGASRIEAQELQVVPSAALGADEAGAVGVDQVSGGLPRDIQLAEVASEHKAGVRPEGDAQATGVHVAAERVLRRLAADWRYQASNARSNRACLIRCAHQLEATVTTLMPPDGYVLVPLVLPVEMEIAFMEAWVLKRRCIDDPEMQDAWAAALAARPEVL